jgi:hypothetical protein
VGVAEAIAWRYLELISQQSGLAGARRILICTMAPLAETAKSIYKHMSEFPEKALWKHILRSSEMRMFTSRQTNAMAFDRMEQTRKAIRSSQESIRRSDEFIRRVMPISR